MTCTHSFQGEIHQACRSLSFLKSSRLPRRTKQQIHTCTWVKYTISNVGNQLIGPWTKQFVQLLWISGLVSLFFLNNWCCGCFIFCVNAPELFPGHFFIDFWIGISTLGSTKSRFSQGRYCKHPLFTEIVFYGFRGRLLPFFGSVGDRFSDFLGLENRLENRRVFGDVTDLAFLIWGRRSTSDLGLLKRYQHSPIAEKQTANC